MSAFHPYPLDTEEQTGNIAPPHSGVLAQIGTKQVQFGWALLRRTDAMIAALGTLTFLATLWLLVVVGAAVLEESGAKIAAALKGTAKRQPSINLAPMRVRARARVKAPMRAEPRWRAAA